MAFFCRTGGCPSVSLSAVLADWTKEKKPAKERQLPPSVSPQLVKLAKNASESRNDLRKRHESDWEVVGHLK